MNEGTSALKLEEPEIKDEVAELVEVTSKVIVTDKESLGYAQDQVLELDTMKKRVVAYWEIPKKQAHDAWKTIVGREKEMLDPIESRRKSLKGSVDSFLTDERRRLQEEQRKADEEKRKRETEERARLEKEAEEAIQIGDEQAAEMIMEEIENVDLPAQIIQPEIEKTVRSDTGTMSQKLDVEVEVTDLASLCKEIAEGRAPVSIIDVKKGPLKSWVKLQGHKKFPGLSIVEKVSSSFRGKA